MAKKIHKTKKTPLFKNVGFYFVLLYALLTLGMIVQVFTVNVIPMKYAMIICLILLLLLLGMYYLQLGRKVNKVNKVLGKILIVILAVFLGIGNWYLFKTGSAFSRMTGDAVSYTHLVLLFFLKYWLHLCLNNRKYRK